MRSKSMKLVSVVVVVAVVLLGGNIMLLATGAPAQAAVQIDRDRIKNVIYPTFGYPSITRCGDNMAIEFAHTRFCLPDGQTSQGRQTFTLVQNPNASEVTIEVTYMTDTSGGNVTFDDKVPANSRRTYDMSKVMSPGRASVLVQCKTAGKKVMVERSMYWNNKGAGTDSIGSYAD